MSASTRQRSARKQQSAVAAPLRPGRKPALAPVATAAVQFECGNTVARVDRGGGRFRNPSPSASLRADGSSAAKIAQEHAPRRVKRRLAERLGGGGCPATPLRLDRGRSLEQIAARFHRHADPSDARPRMLSAQSCAPAHPTRCIAHGGCRSRASVTKPCGLRWLCLLPGLIREMRDRVALVAISGRCWLEAAPTWASCDYSHRYFEPVRRSSPSACSARCSRFLTVSTDSTMCFMMWKRSKTIFCSASGRWALTELT